MNKFKTMKFIYRLTIILSICMTSFSRTHAQEPSPIILHGPEDWRYEKIDFPLDFAPELSYKGFEELRFAPGMFNVESPTYFTYVFAISIEKASPFTKKELEEFFLIYYKGLCTVVAKSKKQSVDISQIQVSFKKGKKESSHIQNYRALITYLDTFNDGQKIELHMELEITENKETGKSHLLALVSPQGPSTAIWEKLRQIRKNTRSNLSKK